MQAGRGCLLGYFCQYQLYLQSKINNTKPEGALLELNTTLLLLLILYIDVS